MALQQVTIKMIILRIIQFALFLDLLPLFTTIDDCKEQWNSVKLPDSDWDFIGDAQRNSDGGILFYRDPGSKMTIEDIGGAAWFKLNKNNLNGVKISFKPTIGIDFNYYGNVKYPQGFAFVFTTSKIDKLIGEKRSGLGYDGINNAVAFEFDFLQNSDKTDIKLPHFSAHYNLAGPISSGTPPKCLICNKPLPNFYDSQKENYVKDLKFTIEVYGGKLSVYSNQGEYIMRGMEFDQLETLMESNEVFFGVTSSMNLYKSILLTELEFARIENSQKTVLSLPNKLESYPAGKTVDLNFFVNSACGTALKVFPQEFAKFHLNFNGLPWDQNINLAYDKKIHGLVVSVRNLHTAGKYNFYANWKGIDGNSLEVTIAPGNIDKFDLCDDSIYDPYSGILANKGNTMSKTFTFTVCATDQFSNLKSLTGSYDNIVTIGYPYSYPHDTQMKVETKDNKKFKVTVPLTGVGRYTIYNEKFFNGVEKYFDVTVGGVDPELSIGEIRNYFDNKVTNVNTPIVLLMRLKDSYGNVVTNDQITEKKCDFSMSTVEYTYKTEKKVDALQIMEIKDDLPSLTYLPRQPGEFTFKPRVQCSNDKNAIEIKCELCTFFIPTSELDKSRFKLYSDFKDQKFMSNELSLTNPLYISLDEGLNRKLTQITFVDTSGVDISVPKIDPTNIYATISSPGSDPIALTAKFNPAGLIELLIPIDKLTGGKDRSSLFSPLLTYAILLKIDDPVYTISTPLNIPVVFSYKDDYLNNVNNIDTTETPGNFLVQYIPGTLTLRAAASQLLFRVISRNANKELTLGTGLVCSKITTTAKLSDGTSVDIEPTCVKSGMFLYISAVMKMANTYIVDLNWDTQKLSSVPIKIIPRDEVTRLDFDKNHVLISTADTEKNIITLKDIDVGKVFSFPMAMLDEFGNKITENYLTSFTTIAFTNDGTTKLQPLYSGELAIIGESFKPGNYQIILTLPTKLQYTITWMRKSIELDPSLSISQINLKGTTLDVPIEATVQLHDKFNSDITEAINGNPDLKADFVKNTQVYLMSDKNDIITLSIDRLEAGVFYFKGTPTVAGEYQLMTFYKNIPIQCTVCFVKYNALTADLTKTTAYLVGTKGSLMLYSDKNYYQLIAKNENIVFFLVFRDKFGNEVYNEKSYSLVLTQTDSGSTKVKFCGVQSDKKETKQYYQVCGEDMTAFKSLSEGTYHIAVDTLKFKLVIDENLLEEDTQAVPAPSNELSFVRNENQLATGTSETPARIVIDFRSPNNLRYANINTDMIKIGYDKDEMKDLKVTYFYGPLKGLITAVLSTKYIGDASLKIQYNGVEVITGASLNIKPGRINNISYIPNSLVSYGKQNMGTYALFQLLDSTGVPCKFSGFDDEYLKTYLVSTFHTASSAYIRSVNSYNPMTGILSVNLESQFKGEIKFESPFMSTPVTVKMPKVFSKDTTFGYIEDDKVSKPGDSVKMKFIPLDSYHNELTFDEAKDSLAKISLMMFHTKDSVTKYLATLTPQIDETAKSMHIPIVFDKPGDYLFIPLYDNMELHCNMCRRQVEQQTPSIVLANTQLLIKTPSGWNDKTVDMMMTLFQHTYPMFKLIFADAKQSQVGLMDGYLIDFLIDDSKSTEPILETKVYSSKNGDVYVYLTENGRKKYQALKPLQPLKLRIRNSKSSESIEFINFVMLHSEKVIPPTTPCNADAVPQFTSKQHSFRAGSDVMIEFTLKGCLAQELSLFDDGFIITSPPDWTRQIIPAESNGKYLLFLSYNIVPKESAAITVQFKQSAFSEAITVNMRPEYSIKKVSYAPAGEFTSIDTFGAVYVYTYDAYNNPITRDSSSVLYNDMYVDLTDSAGRKIPYKVTFNTAQNAYLVEFPIYYSDKYTVSSSRAIEKFEIQVLPSDHLNRSFASIVKNAEGNFEATLTLRDDKYKPFSPSTKLQYASAFSFRYYTYNTITKENFIYDFIDVTQKENSNILLLSLPKDIPQFQLYVILPYAGKINPIVCASCFLINTASRFVYEFDSEKSTNSMFAMPIANGDTLDSTKERVLYMYETTSQSPIAVTSPDSLSPYEVNSYAHLGGIFNQIYFGLSALDKSNQSITEGHYSFSLDKDVNFIVFFDTNPVATTNLPDPSNTNIHSKKVLNYKSGDLVSFFIEVRDKGNKLTTKTTLVTLTEQLPDLKYSILIPSCYPGYYQVILSSEIIPKSSSFVFKITEGETPWKIFLRAKSSFPVTIDVQDQEVIDWLTVRYTVLATDKNTNIVCDKRMNMILKTGNEIKPYELGFDTETNTCKAYFYFTGMATLDSPLFLGKIMNLSNLGSQTVSPLNSVLSIDMNNSQLDANILATFRLFSSTGYEYPSSASRQDMKLRIYLLSTFTSRTLVKEITGLSTMSITLKPSSIPMEQGSDYLIVGVIDGNEIGKMCWFKYFKSFYQVPFSFQANIKQSYVWKPAENLYAPDPTNKNFDYRFDLKYPFSIMLNFVNSDNQKIGIPKSAVITATLLSDPSSPDYKSDSLPVFTFEGIRNSETTYLFNVVKTEANKFIHLPRGSYVISLKSTIPDLQGKVIEKWLPINFKDGLFQNSDVVVPYSLPGIPLGNDLQIVGAEESINANVDSFSKSSICIKSDGKIWNEYLDSDYIQITGLDSNVCKLFISVTFRGCAEVFVNCNQITESTSGYTATLAYRDAKINGNIIILVDPKLPPASTVVISPFPATAKAKTEIVADFNLLDATGKVFKSISSKSFELYINDKAVSSDKWKVWYQNNLKVWLKLDYPPREQKIILLLKDPNGGFIQIKDLSTTVKISQGEIDPKKSRISLPIYYLAGNNLAMKIILKDTYNNCWEDDLDLKLFRLRLTVGGTSYEKFTFEKESLSNFLVCKSMIKVATEVGSAAPLTQVGVYKLELFYQDSTTAIATENIQVLPNILSAEKTNIVVAGLGAVKEATVKAGTLIDIQMKGTDAYGNPVSYWDISERMKIVLDDIALNKDYYFSAKLGDSNDYLLMSLIVNPVNRYKVKYLLDNNPFLNQNGLTDLIVSPGICSAIFPNINMNENKFYPGDYGVLTINCQDNFKNPIIQKGDEKFSIDIKGQELEIIGEDRVPYDLIFNTGVYNAKFLLAYQGKYTVTAYLNGYNYGPSFSLTVKSQQCTHETPYMCEDKTCVANPASCKFTFDTQKCTPQDLEQRKFYYCKTGTELKCSQPHTCDCPDGMTKCSGMCLPSQYDFCSHPIATSCQEILSIDKSLEVKSVCNDGSCRVTDQCPNQIGCPLGYTPCGAKCIRTDEICRVNLPKCEQYEVVCWDLSCASSYENCPTRRTCKNPDHFVCPDGKCVASYFECSQPPKCYAPFAYLCDDFTCKKSESDCSKKIVCPLGQHLCEDNQCAYKCEESSCPATMFLCPTGQCVGNSLLCPSSLSCPAGWLKCKNGACTKSLKDCIFATGVNALTCPLTFPILCPDLSCVETASQCKALVDCPPLMPFRCWNNECRTSIENCPTQTTCPAEYPVRCSDGTCQKAAYHCSRIQNTCPEVRCSDGSCASSISLCPSQVTCGPQQIRCWDGACVNEISECRDPKYIACPANQPIRCPDGSCRKDRPSCSTISVCPDKRPVKCYDGSCREHINLCPPYQTCGKNMKSCPDGTCTSDKCNTIVTCHYSRPFLCYDNSCKPDIRDCPNPPTCENGIICPDGTCVSNRQTCKFFEPCPPQNPVRCPQGSCSTSVEECNSLIRECPIGYVKCKTGGCRPNEALCEPFTCPLNFPYLCPEGTCVEDKKYCDDQITACPYNRPYKCNEGTCVKNAAECADYTNATCPPGTSLCPDGSCRKDADDCPYQNGCSGDKKFKCADGTCINKKTTSCSPPVCPFDNPISCQSGECVSTTAMCPQNLKALDFQACESEGFIGLYMCADGRCVPTAEYCRPLYRCPSGFERCSDGTCKVSTEICPISTNCPSSRPVRCSFGKCVPKESECYSNVICPPDFPVKCDKTGECAQKEDQCSGQALTANGCTQEGLKFKCPDGRCMADELQCKTVNIACDLSFPILCPNGECRKKLEECTAQDIKCPKDMVRCQNGKCVDQGKEEAECQNKMGCPPFLPFRCANGDCVASSILCPAAISCNSLTPVLCADRSCVSDPKYCNVFYPCLKTEERCDNGYCVKYKENCKDLAHLCPLSIPVKCPSGRCVKHFHECSLEYSQVPCKEGEFFCVLKSTCVSSATACVGSSVSGVVPGTYRRMLGDGPVKVVPENQCSIATPYSCYDGTCAKERELCPTLPACKVFEYRCANGSCQRDVKKCAENSITCEDGYSKCEDGLCRKECPPFNGCGLNQFQCTNGMCVKNHLECIGYSMCEEVSTPYRCMDGKCVSDPSACVDIKRLNAASSLEVSVSRNNPAAIQFAYDRNNRNIGALFIPGSSLNFVSNSTSSTGYGIINIQDVPHSKLYSTSLYNNSDAFMFNVSNGLPGSDGILGFENSVVSPIVSISSPDLEEKLNHWGTLYLEHNYYLYNRFKTSDYCLAKLVQNSWICKVRKETDDQKAFSFDSLGIYAIVLMPSREFTYISYDESTNFFVDNMKIILIVLSSLTLFCALVFYIFTRVIRYREKYKDNKEKMINLQNQIEEYKNMTTDVPGQTLGDNIQGIVFTRNPAHSIAAAKKGVTSEMEFEVEELQRKCKAIESQNKRLEDNIQDVNDQYRALKSDIDRMKK